MINQSDTLLELLMEQRKMNMNQQQQLNNQQALIEQQQVQIGELRKQTEFLLNGYYSSHDYVSEKMPANVIPLNL